MHPRRRAALRAHPTVEEEAKQREAEQTEQSEVRELRAQVAQISEALRRQEEMARLQEETARRQEANMVHMMRMLEQRASPVVSPVVPPAATLSTSTQMAPLTL